MRFSTVGHSGAAQQAVNTLSLYKIYMENLTKWNYRFNPQTVLSEAGLFNQSFKKP